MKRIENKKPLSFFVMHIMFLFLLAHCLCGCALNEQEKTVVMESSENMPGDYGMSESAEWSTNVQEVQTTNASEATSQLVYVHVCGAVKNPGVYALLDGARVVDAITAAGGFRKKADETVLNQAELVVDGQRLYVPSKEETKDSGVVTGEDFSEATSQSLVNLNQATKEQLMTLPGIGEAKAAMIIQYRQEHGAFTAIEDIMNIEGIKEGVFSKIKDYITVG